MKNNDKRQRCAILEKKKKIEVKAQKYCML